MLYIEILSIQKFRFWLPRLGSGNI